MTFNPWSSKTFLKTRFFDHPEDPDIFTLTTTYKCNEWLDEADLRIFERMKVENPRRYRIEGEGDWGISEGLIYDKVELQAFDVQPLREKPNTEAVFGLDFGFTDPTAFVAIIIDHDEKKLYVFDEFYKKGLTNERIAQMIGAMGYDRQRIICDAAEPKSIVELQELGIKAEPSRKGRDSVLHGIQLLQNYTWIVHPRCENFYHEICNYAWEKDKYGKPVDKPEHEFSHLMDASRYCVCRRLVGDAFSFD